MKAYKAIKGRVYTRSGYSTKKQIFYDLYMGGEERIFTTKKKAKAWLGKVGIFKGAFGKTENILEEVELN